MTKIYLIRHGKAAAGFDASADPDLDDTGRLQAAATARMLQTLGPMPILSSPLARAQQTAAALAALWQTTVVIEKRVSEIPSPSTDLAARSSWLRAAMQGSWSDLDETLIKWRDNLVGCLLEIPADCMVFSHFVAINAAVGAASNDDRMVVFRPDNASVTTLESDGSRLRVLELGKTADTHVN
ncbi:MAG: histidine phosphatase family protein [Proteobacteria bacterium]|nr:histidine phosphatase family protein [Pseudomonadota bacterium]